MSDWRNEVSLAENVVENEVEQEAEKLADFSKNLNEDADFARFCDAENNLEDNTEASLKIIMELADEDKGYALHRLSVLYFEGKYLPQDYEKAFQYAERGANVAGNLSSMALLAQYYINGQGTEQNVSKGIEILTEGFETTKDVIVWLVNACVFAHMLVQTYSRMDGYIDFEKALFYGRYGAEHDYYDIQVDLGDIYCNERYAGCDYKESNNWYRKSLQHAEVMPVNHIFIRASMVKNYLKMEKEDFDFADAMALLDQIEEDKKSLNGQDPLSGEDWYLRGEVYSRNTPADYVNAIRCYEIAFQGEDNSEEVKGKAAYRMARCYFQGLGVEENFDKGDTWLGDALDCQNVDAWGDAILSELHRNGEKDWQSIINTALECVQASTHVGSAYYTLGMAYFLAPAPYADWVKGLECMNKAIEHKDSMVEYYALNSADLHDVYSWLFWVYTNANPNSPIAADYNKAYEIAKLEYEAKYSNGNKHLGNCYENGWGVERDIDKAIEYYSMEDRTEGIFACKQEKERVEGIKRAEFIQKKGKMPMIASIAAVVVQYVLILNIARYPLAFILSLITAFLVGRVTAKKMNPENEKKTMIISVVISLAAGFIYPMIQF